MGTVTKKELIERVSAKSGLKRSDARRAVQAMLEEIIGTLGSGDRIELRDFGVFELRTRKPRMAQNPKTLERVPVPAKNTVKFKAGRLMQQAVDEAPIDETSQSSSAEAKPSASERTPAELVSSQG